MNENVFLFNPVTAVAALWGFYGFGLLAGFMYGFTTRLMFDFSIKWRFNRK